MIELLNNKKILFIGAHLDDIEIGAGGLISMLDNNENFAFVVSSGHSSHAGSHYKLRQDVFFKNMNECNFSKENTRILIDEPIDTCFRFDENFERIRRTVGLWLPEINPDVIVMNSKDNHTDHLLLNQIIKEIYRPINREKPRMILEYQTPPSMIYDYSSEDYNCIIGFDSDIMLKKFSMLQRYPIPSLNDIRDIEYIKKINEANGMLSYGENNFAEKFKLTIFS